MSEQAAERTAILTLRVPNVEDDLALAALVKSYEASGVEVLSVMSNGAHLDDRPRGGFVLRGGYCWGYGATLAEARAKFRAAGGKLREPHQVFVFDRWSVFDCVDRYGAMNYYGNDPIEVK